MPVERVGDPEEVVEIAEAAGGFLDVGLLEEDGVGVLAVAAADVGEAFVEEGAEVFLDGLAAELAEELAGEGLVPGEVAAVEESGAGGGVLLGEGDALGGRAHGVADAEAEVPEEGDEISEEDGEGGRNVLGGLGDEEEEVEVGGGAEGLAPVAAVGEEGDAVLLPGRAGKGGLEKAGEDEVEEVGALPGGVEAGGAGVVGGADFLFPGAEDVAAVGKAFLRGEALRERLREFHGGESEARGEKREG